MSDRLTRKEIKQQDTFMTTTERAVHWMQDNARTIMYAALAVVAGILLIVFWRQYSERRADNAQYELSKALRVAQATIVGEGETADASDPLNPTYADEDARSAAAREAFETLKADYGSTSAGQVAAVYLGKLAAEAGDSDQARVFWNDFLAKSDDPMLIAQVQSNLFDLDLSEGKVEEVVAELQRRLGDSASSELPEDALLWQLGSSLEELGRSGEAQTYFERLTKEFPTSPYRALALPKLPAGS